ncbi:tRNA(Ile)-lysidine synthase [Dyadobacter sp. CECT 9623]|uniref:tRNA(Ile)-lysidine synthase n=1 Tax=Dyadobacter linearis TaxID=2823330 RepID=A0ABM8UVM3_9BACT|nr:tRNA lysidine(34) synthetase TilS [Dyadobacter sp. CECT 9623]CAG5072854.1 tRNA(Ile)-lysidine synthase [Dyadobacter sp. CECT 9623]
MDSFLTFINQQAWELNQKRSLLTVSGGVDSIVLAHLFYLQGFRAGIAHCNFKLRGDESDADEQFVREIAALYGFEFFVTEFDTKRLAGEKGISTQMIARELRYKWFEEVRNDNQYDWIATAHHANDSLETTLLNLARGTGLPGLKGIAPHVNAIIRPLLQTTKEEILTYARENSLPWREDRSNSSLDYKRNRIRHEIIPVLQKLNSSIETTFINTSERLQAAENLLEELLETWKRSAVYQENGLIYIDKGKLLTSTEPAFRLWSVLQEYKFSYAQVKPILTALNGTVGKTFSSASYELLLDRNHLILRRRTPQVSGDEITVWGPGSAISIGNSILFFEGIAQVRINELGKDKSLAFIDLEKVQWPLTIRKWKTGDTFFPFGMEGMRKKLSDLFSDLKMDRFQKGEIQVLVNGNGEIIWVIGIRSDERYKVSNATSKVLKVALINKLSAL